MINFHFNKDKSTFGVERTPQRIFGQLKFHIYVR